MEMGLQTEDWAPGAERHILVWHGGEGGGDRGTAGRMDGWAQTSQHQSLLLSCRCLHHITYFCSKPLCSAYIFVHTDVNLPLCMDLYLYETVILFPCHPCVETVHSSH